MAPDDSGVLEALVVGFGAVVDWEDRLVVIGAVTPVGADAWVTGDGHDWERRRFDPPPGCDGFGGVAVVGSAAAVSCREADAPTIAVAVSDDLDDWTEHPVGVSGPSFGTTIGVGSGGGLVVTSYEAAIPTRPTVRLRGCGPAVAPTSTGWTEVLGDGPTCSSTGSRLAPGPLVTPP